MFEADNQVLIDEYFAGIIKEAHSKVRYGYGKTMELTINR